MSELQNYTYRRVWRILRRGDGIGRFETRPYGTVDTVSLGSHAAPHGFAIGSTDRDAAAEIRDGPNPPGESERPVPTPRQ